MTTAIGIPSLNTCSMNPLTLYEGWSIFAILVSPIDLILTGLVGIYAKSTGHEDQNHVRRLAAVSTIQREETM